MNDLWDRDLDSKVERTKGRPLASGALNPAQAIGGGAGRVPKCAWGVNDSSWPSAY